MDSAGWDARYAETELVWGAAPNRFVVEVLGDVKPGRALDLACGEGRNAVWLATQGWRATGVDFSAAGVDKGRRLAGAAGVEVEWVVADLLTYRPPALEYSGIVLAYLHLAAADLATVLDAAAGALAPGGTLMAVGHDLANLTEGVGGPQDPAVLYTPEAVVAALPGLRVLRAGSVRRDVPGDAGRQAVDTLVVATRD